MSRQRMTVQRTGGNGAKVALMIYTILFWTSGLALIFIGLWMLLDPKRNYILTLVDFSEDDPLLTFASYIAIVAGVVSLFVGFIGCCGAVQRMRCLLVGFILCLLALFLADVGMGTLALVYRNKFANGRLRVYVQNMTKNRYNRDKWVQPLLDTVQFYLTSPQSNLEENLRNIIKFSYGVSMEIEDSRRITVLIDKLQFYQQCCGGEGPRDYYNSFWFITNTYRGTRSFVPPSCCRQSQQGRAWAPVPIDPMCTTYRYDSKAFESSVYNEGCHEKLLQWVDEQTWIFAGVGFGFAALMIVHSNVMDITDPFQVVGMVISLILCNSVKYYTFVRDDY
ncbi:unnamed protein product [Cylicocyclus nassatus]|uniref:Tetraspanin n=1 Tax=Cylicocyclus nassatus TaxID=53992 RepID=A0AA36MDH8_CYLNA|nr:unnamed protein product [Cylicocyclus nassatus]